jgi:transposase
MRSTKRPELTDEQWKRRAPLLPRSCSALAPLLLRSTAAFVGFRRAQGKGGWQRIFTDLKREADARGELDWAVHCVHCVHGTICGWDDLWMGRLCARIRTRRERVVEGAATEEKGA